MKLTAEQVNEILEAAKPDIVRGLKEEIIASARVDVSVEAGRLVRKEVEAFIAEHVIPEVRAALIESKDGLVKVAIPLAEAVTESLAAGLAEQFKKNMEQSWTRSEIFKKLFQ